jgi:putative membrane protein
MRYPYYNNGGAHWGLWIGMIVAMLVILGILAWAVVNIIRHKDHLRNAASQPANGTGGSGPLHILDERLARGEIEVDEYTRRRDLIRGSGLAPGPGDTSK